MKIVTLLVVWTVMIAAMVYGETPDAATAAEPSTQPSAGESERKVTPSGLTIIEVGKGEVVATAGDTVWVKYVGRLQDGTKFDSSEDHTETKNGISFQLGSGRVIKGWEEGIAGMKLGDKRQLIIPPDLGYGAAPQGPIPGNSTLTFDVELVGLKHGPVR